MDTPSTFVSTILNHPRIEFLTLQLLGFLLLAVARGELKAVVVAIAVATRDRLRCRD